MPTQRFDRLREEKQKLISNAVMDEFQRTSYGELRISRIARNAHISRGSLYTYFHDKEDMFLFALNQTWKSVLEYNKHALLENGGDYWEMMLSSLKYHLRICRSNQICRLLYMASEHAAAPWEALFFQLREEEYRRYKEWIYRHMNQSGPDISPREEWEVIEDTCQSLLMVSLQRYIHGGGTEEIIEQDFENKLLQIKKGACVAR